jgi:D-sedoheptulose 7-phosphate isomerase
MVETSLQHRVFSEIDELRSALSILREATAPVVSAACLITDALRSGGKVMFCGNGGSAADAQHLAAEFMGRYLRDRVPLPALALTVDTSALTAIGNDYGYPEVFARQLRGVGRPGDVLVGISTSGKSANVILALKAAREIGARTIAMTGMQASEMATLADIVIQVPASRTNRIQEMHITVGHIICGIVEDALC